MPIQLVDALRDRNMVFFNQVASSIDNSDQLWESIQDIKHQVIEGLQWTVYTISLIQAGIELREEGNELLWEANMKNGKYSVKLGYRLQLLGRNPESLWWW